MGALPTRAARNPVHTPLQEANAETRAQRAASHGDLPFVVGIGDWVCSRRTELLPLARRERVG